MHIHKIVKNWRKITSTITLATFILSPNLVFAADWVNEWANSYTYTGPSTYSNSSRTFANGGSFHARWGESTTEPIFTMAPPKVKAGCGGIDAFMGSFSYLNFDRLVQKLKKMSTGAVAAFAFDIAMNVLCTPCSNALKSLEAISNALNGLQLGDCMSAKTMKAEMTNFGTQMGHAFDDAGQALSQTESLISGNDYMDLKGKTQNAQVQMGQAWNKTIDSYWSSLTSDCNGLIKNIFQQEGPILAKFLTDSTVLGSSDAQNLARAFVGDIYVLPNSTGASAATYKIDACPDNLAVDIDAFVSGNYSTRGGGWPMEQCLPAVATGIYSGKAYSGGLGGLVKSVLTDIADQSQKGHTLSPSSLRLISETPAVPISMIAAVSWRQPGANAAGVEARLQSYSDIIARIMAYQAIDTLLRGAVGNINTGWSRIHQSLNNPNGTVIAGTPAGASAPTTTLPPSTGNDANQCDIKAFAGPAKEIDEWVKASNAEARTELTRLKSAKIEQETRTFDQIRQEWAAIKEDALGRIANKSVAARIERQMAK